MINLKNTLSFTTDQQGFVLPYVLFFIALALIIMTANIGLYQNEIRITENQTEQLKIETLLQMARTQFKEDVVDQPNSNHALTYAFPYGDVIVEYTQLSEKKYHLYFTIRTDTGATHNIMDRITPDYE